MKKLLALMLLLLNNVYGEELRIEGELEKPEAYFIFQRKSFDFLNNIDMGTVGDPVKLIVDAVSSDVF
jgi:hypothetical protein